MGSKPTNAHWLDLEDAIHVPIVAATTGELVALVAGKRIVVVALHVRADVAGTIQFTASGDLTGDMMIAAGEGIHESDYESGLFETPVGVEPTDVLCAETRSAGDAADRLRSPRLTCISGQGPSPEHQERQSPNLDWRDD